MSDASESISRSVPQPASGDARRRRDDDAYADGFALGIAEPSGWWVWRTRGRPRPDGWGVSPLTLRGTIHVVAWLCGVAAITVLGPALVDWPRLVWFAIAIAVMAFVARWGTAGRRRSTAMETDDPGEVATS